MLTRMAAEQIAALIVGNGSHMCEAGFAIDGTAVVNTVSQEQVVAGAVNHHVEILMQHIVEHSVEVPEVYVLEKHIEVPHIVQRTVEHIQVQKSSGAKPQESFQPTSMADEEVAVLALNNGRL